MASYEVYFSNAGVPATGLTLTWESLTQRDGGGAEGSQPTFTEVGGGWYRFSYSPTESMVGVIDGSDTLDDADRYVPCKFTANDEGILSILTFLADETIQANLTQVAGETLFNGRTLTQWFKDIHVLTLSRTTGSGTSERTIIDEADASYATLDTSNNNREVTLL